MNDALHLQVSIDDQRLRLLSGSEIIREFIISTSTKGIGFQPGSYRTPTGKFRIVEKIGENAPIGTIFQAREPVGICSSPDQDQDQDLILTRILRIEGLDPENQNTYDRYIYLHGTNHEKLLGQPASHGCIRLSNSDVVELCHLIPVGTPLEIQPPQHRHTKLFFFDCDSTLSSIEGIDELARARGPEIFQQVVELTHAAMNGEIPLNEVFPRRMDIIRPDQKTCDEVARLYIKTVTPGARELIDFLKNNGWTPIILSGGFAPLIQPLARDLGIQHVEAVPLYLNPDGSYQGYGDDYPTTRNHGKNEIIREWQIAMNASKTVMAGDGISDLETKSDVDLFIGFGGVVEREKVRTKADVWVQDMAEIATVSWLTMD